MMWRNGGAKIAPLLGLVKISLIEPFSHTYEDLPAGQGLRRFGALCFATVPARGHELLGFDSSIKFTI
jgi:hypothetical protein